MRPRPDVALWRFVVLAAAGVAVLWYALRGGNDVVPPPASADLAPTEFEFSDADALRGLFRNAGYTLDNWDAGDRTVPRFYLAEVPRRWRDEVAPDLPVELKKRYFFFVYTPLVLKANERIATDRGRLLELRRRPARDAADEAWLRALAGQYSLDAAVIDDALLDELVRRVDVVPPSLALAQAAVESGWSTSRFAVLGNALFGQWTWSEDGITPAEQRGELGDYRIRSFATPEQSVAAYMHNLNTHRSYADFRAARAEIRAAGAAPTGAALAPTLSSYSEKGREYVDMLLAVIRVNELGPVDDAELRDMRPVRLVPVGDGVD